MSATEYDRSPSVNRGRYFRPGGCPVKAPTTVWENRSTSTLRHENAFLVTDSVSLFKHCGTAGGTLVAVADQLDDATLAFFQQMFDLARTGAAEELATNLELGLPPNLTNSKGDTLLILAAYHNHPRTVAALLAAGADHSRVNDRGQTALAAAVFRKNSETVTTLLDAGANPHGGSPSAIATAEFFNLPEMLELLRSR